MSTSAQRMNEMISVTDAAVMTMSSVEIAELTEKEHKNVIRDIRVMLRDLGDGSDLSHVKEIKDSRGYTERIDLPKRETLILVSGYNVKLRARIIDRWQELESNSDPKIPQTLPEALRLAADLADNLEKTKKELEVAAPKASALDRIASKTEGAVCLRIAAKLLQMPEKKFIQFAHEKGFIFRNHYSKTWQGYGDKAKKGLVELKITEITRDDGSVKNVEQVLITRAGIAKLAELLEVEICE